MREIVYIGQDRQVVEKIRKEYSDIDVREIESYVQCNSFISSIGNVFDLALTGGVAKSWVELKSEVYPDLILSEVKMPRSKGNKEFVPCGPANIINIQEGLQFPPAAFLLVKEDEYDNGLKEYCNQHSIKIILEDDLMEKIREILEKEVSG